MNAYQPQPEASLRILDGALKVSEQLAKSREQREQLAKLQAEAAEPADLDPLTALPGFEAMRKQQEAFMKTMIGGVPGWGSSGPAREETEEQPAAKGAADELAEIKRQFAELQKKLSKL